MRERPAARVASSLAGDDPLLDEGEPYDAKRVAKALVARYLDELSVDPERRRAALSGARHLVRLLPSNAAELVDVDERTLTSAIDELLRIAWVDDSTRVPDDLAGRVEAEIEAIFAAVSKRAEEEGQRRVFAWDPPAISEDVLRAILPLLPRAQAMKTRARQEEAVRDELLRQMEWLKWNWGDGRGAAQSVVAAVWARLNLETAPATSAEPQPDRAYRPDDRYAIDDVVVHARFGRGRVVARTDTSISVDFDGTIRKLAAENDATASGCRAREESRGSAEAPVHHR